MKTLKSTLILLIMAAVVPMVNADSFGFFYQHNGFSMEMQTSDYDYYDRYSPGFYDSGEVDFYMALNPYGRWVWIDDFDDYIWVPNVAVTWRPYYNGSWTYTQYGWTWVSYEPWGWIPHHYGRWFFHPVYHWIWIPGTTWGPAYVTWGYYGGYYSWAPLPPAHCRYYRRHYTQYRYSHRRYRSESGRSAHWYGHDSGASVNRWIPDTAWTFVAENQFTASDISRVSVSQSAVSRFVASGQFKASARAPSVRQVERKTGHRISRVQVDEVRKSMNGKTIRIVRPVNVLEKRKPEIARMKQQKKSKRKSRIDPMKQQRLHNKAGSKNRHHVRKNSEYNTSALKNTYTAPAQRVAFRNVGSRPRVEMHETGTTRNTMKINKRKAKTRHVRTSNSGKITRGKSVKSKEKDYRKISLIK